MFWLYSSAGGTGAGVSSVVGRAVAACSGSQRSSEGLWGAVVLSSLSLCAVITGAAAQLSSAHDSAAVVALAFVPWSFPRSHFN